MAIDPGVQSGVIRGKICAALRIEYPRSVSSESVLVMLKEMGHSRVTAIDVRSHFEYLKDKDFIEITKRRRNFWEAKLMPKGVDFLEGNDDYEGVAFPI